MANVTLIVEGIADYKFLRDLISFRFNTELFREDFIVVDGKSESLHKVKEDILKSSVKGKRNILIFDSDDGGQISTLEKINLNKDNFAIEGIFLFPDNNPQSNGNLETLLRHAISSNGLGLLPCIDGYSTCVSNLEIENLRHIDEKAKIFIYVDSFQDGGSSKEKDRDYLKTNLWNLNSVHLTPLVDFLATYFINE
jgi:hypothetical protein